MERIWLHTYKRGHRNAQDVWPYAPSASYSGATVPGLQRMLMLLHIIVLRPSHTPPPHPLWRAMLLSIYRDGNATLDNSAMGGVVPYLFAVFARSPAAPGVFCGKGLRREAQRGGIRGTACVVLHTTSMDFSEIAGSGGPPLEGGLLMGGRRPLFCSFPDDHAREGNGWWMEWPAWSGQVNDHRGTPRGHPAKGRRYSPKMGEKVPISQSADETRVSGAGLPCVLMLLHRPCCACPTAGCKYDAHTGRAGQAVERIFFPCDVVITQPLCASNPFCFCWGAGKQEGKGANSGLCPKCAKQQEFLCCDAKAMRCNTTDRHWPASQVVRPPDGGWRVAALVQPHLEPVRRRRRIRTRKMQL